MKYYRCKCGKAEMWGSDGPSPCQGCDECKTVMGWPNLVAEPIPHEWTTETTMQDGKVIREITYCKRCHRRKTKSESAFTNNGGSAEYEKGYRTRWNGESEFENPYCEGTVAYDDWRKGWRDRDMEYFPT